MNAPSRATQLFEASSCTAVAVQLRLPVSLVIHSFHRLPDQAYAWPFWPFESTYLKHTRPA